MAETKERKFTGHVTMADGTHVPLSHEEAKAMWADMERRKAERAARLPDTKAALDALTEAYHRLTELGWRDAVYCPKDGSNFEVIEAGSTGIHRARYEGEWPKGGWWIDDCPSRPILRRLYPEDEAKRVAKMKEAVASHKRICETEASD